MVLPKGIRAGARVISDSLPANSTAELTADLEPGYIKTARVKNANGIVKDSIVRIVRDKSIRMTFDPYYLFASPITRVVGRVVSNLSEAPLPGAQVRLDKINDVKVEPNDVRGAIIYTSEDINNNKIALGTEKDISATTNERGDYNLYFSNETLASYQITDDTLEKLKNANVPGDVRNKLDALNDNYRGYERFLLALREALSRDDLNKYRSEIITYSENFIRKLTLKATLDGFKPVWTDVDICTAERKVLNFQLEKT